MKRRTLEQGLELVEKYRASGFGQERFAKQRKIKVATNSSILGSKGEGCER